MKKYLLSFILLLTLSTTAFTQDLQDTVAFDLLHATQQSGYVEFPVYFLSNDSINALDFNIQYNTGRFAFDSVLNLVPANLQITYNEHIDTTTTHDTTILFTSLTMSLQSLTNNTPIVKVRFAILTPGPFCAEDIDSLAAYLNGNLVTAWAVDCSTVGITDIENGPYTTGIYPNPANENALLEFSLAAKSRVAISVRDITGKVVYEINPSEYSSGPHKLTLPLSNLESGLYVVRINSGNETKSARLSVIR